MSRNQSFGIKMKTLKKIHRVLSSYVSQTVFSIFHSNIARQDIAGHKLSTHILLVVDTMTSMFLEYTIGV